MYEIVFISTCCNHTFIYKLINSVVKFNNSINTLLIIVNQDQNNLSVKNLINENNKIHVIEHGHNVNTSVGRNIGINFLLNNDIKFKFIAFPDDDSSYDHAFFREIDRLISINLNANFVTDVYCTGSNDLFRIINKKVHSELSKSDFGLVGAVNIVLNYETFNQVRLFDERFGVNAIYGAGEDGDYFIRGLYIQPFYYSANLYSYHPSNLHKFQMMSYSRKRLKLQNYGRGVMALLVKHKMYRSAFIVVCRALGGFLLSLTKLEIALSFAYLEAFFTRFYSFIYFTLFGLKKLNKNG